MKSENRGYRIENCHQCRNFANDTISLERRIERLLEEEELPAFLKQRIHGPIRAHHELRIGLAAARMPALSRKSKRSALSGPSVPGLRMKSVPNVKPAY